MSPLRALLRRPIVTSLAPTIAIGSTTVPTSPSIGSNKSRRLPPAYAEPLGSRPVDDGKNRSSVSAPERDVFRETANIRTIDTITPG